MTTEHFDSPDSYDEPDWPPETQEEPPDRRRLMFNFMLGTTSLVLLSGAWAIYVVRDDWWAPLAPIGVLAAMSTVYYRLNRTTQTMLGLTIVNLAHTWLVFAARLSLLALSFGALFTLWFVHVVLIQVRGTEEEAFRRSVDTLTRPVKESRRAHRSMTPGEMMWQEEPRHPIVFLPLEILLLGLAACTVLWLPWNRAVAYGWVLLLVVVLILVFLWHRDRICFTDWRVFRTYGLVGRKLQQMAYAKMTDESVIVPWHSVILAKLRFIGTPYGTLILESAGQQQALTKIRWVQNIEAIKVKMSERTRKSNE